MSIGIDQVPISNRLIIGSDHRLRAPAEERRAIGALRPGDLIQPIDQIVIELHEHLPSSHIHMVSHMADLGVEMGREQFECLRHVGGQLDSVEAELLDTLQCGRDVGWFADELAHP